MAIKLEGSEIALTTANTVGDSSVVRLYATANVVITQAYANTDIVGTFTLGAGQQETIYKGPTDTLAANTACRAVPVRTVFPN